MTDNLTKKDREFLRAVGITVEDATPTFFEQRLALAKRIAKHVAPTAQANPEVARSELMRLAAREIRKAAQTDGTLALLVEYHIPVTRRNYLVVAFLGNPPTEPLDGEIEAGLPWFLREDNR
jgi:hypothetical protein